MKHLRRLGLAAALLASPPALAAGPVVVELFTSQSCSSCPPADELLAELDRVEPGILPLGLHVTYWDRLGWKDPYSLPAATDRQHRYAEQFGARQVYTPQMVVGGRHQAIGSDRPAVLAALAAARADAARLPGPALSLQPDGDGLRVTAGAGQGTATSAATSAATLWLVGFDPRRTTAVRGGENGGRTLTEVNVVRAMRPVGEWRGAALALSLPRPPGERAAVLLQDASGRILAASAPR